MKTISIVIPVKNGASTLKRCLDAIISQTLIDQTEIIIIDSGSTDGTLELIRNYPFLIRLYEIPPEDFSHGGTRNYGVSLAKGEFVVMTVQDAWASSKDWLEIMLAHFKRDKKVSAVVGQQVAPHQSGVNPHQWYRPVSKPRLIETYFENTEEYTKLNGREQHNVTFSDDVNTMYRKSSLTEHPFKQIEFGEDMLVIKKFLSHRKKVIYDARSSVWHYHFLSKDYTYRVNFTVLYQKHKIFGYTPTTQYRLKDYLLIIYRNFKYKAHIKWILHNINILKAQQKAFNDFIKYKKRGAEALDKYYKSLNPKNVQGKQKV